MESTGLLTVATKCPNCGETIPRSFWDVLKRSFTCPECGEVWRQYTINKEDDRVSIIVPPDKMSKAVYVVYAIVLILMIYLSFVGEFQGGLQDQIFAYLIFLIFSLLFGGILITLNSGTRNFIDSYMASKEIILEDNRVIVKILRENNDKEFVFQCSRENSPHATCQEQNNVCDILVKSGGNSVRFGVGMKQSSLEKIAALIENFFQGLVEITPEIPAHVETKIASLNKGESIKIADFDPESPEADESSIQKSNKNETSEIPAVDIIKEKGGILIESKSPVAAKVMVIFIFVAVSVFVWYFQGPGIIFFLFAIFLLLQGLDIRTWITREGITIKYQAVWVIKWKRNIELEDIIGIGDNLFRRCSIKTYKGDFQISNLIRLESRNEFTLTVKKILQEDFNWEQKSRVSIIKEEKGIKSIRLLPNGIFVFDEMGVPLPFIVFFMFLFIPMLCAFELLPLIVARRYFELGESSLIVELAMPYLIAVHAVIFFYMVFKLTKSYIWVYLEQKPIEQIDYLNEENIPDKMIQETLVIKRCIWGEKGFSKKFNINNKDLEVKIQQGGESGAGAAVSHKGICLVKDKDKSSRLGLLCERNELQEIKDGLMLMIGEKSG